MDIQLRIVSFFGLFAFMFIAWLLSSNHRRVNWRIVIGGLLLQFTLAAIVFSSQKLLTFPDEAGIPRYENGILFSAIDSVFVEINEYVEAGSSFLFNIYPRSTDDAQAFPPAMILLRSFVFGVLPTVIFFSALMSVLYYLGIMQWLVRGMAWVMQKTLGTSGAESLAAAANVLVGHTEAPLVIRPFIGSMTRSELNALMVGGFATITGGLMAVFVGMGISAGHLLTASIISAPAALLIAKLLEPETGTPDTMGDLHSRVEREGVNVIEAAAIGASEGMKLALNIAAMLLAFLALVAMLDAMLGGIGELLEWLIRLVKPDFGYDFQWSMTRLLGILFWPVAWLMGIESGDCSQAAEMLGIKMVVNEFVAYGELAPYMDDQNPAAAELSDRTKIILTYALCGFSNFGAIGIQLGGIGGIAPERRSDLARLGLRAMIGGTLACCMTACIAGLML